MSEVKHAPGPRFERTSRCRARRILRDILLFAAYGVVMLSLFTAGALGDMWLGWSGWLLAFGLACFADYVEGG